MGPYVQQKVDLFEARCCVWVLKCNKNNPFEARCFVWAHMCTFDSSSNVPTVLRTTCNRAADTLYVYMQCILNTLAHLPPCATVGITFAIKCPFQIMLPSRAPCAVDTPAVVQCVTNTLVRLAPVLNRLF